MKNNPTDFKSLTYDEIVMLSSTLELEKKKREKEKILSDINEVIRKYENEGLIKPITLKKGTFETFSDRPNSLLIKAIASQGGIDNTEALARILGKSKAYTDNKINRGSFTIQELFILLDHVYGFGAYDGVFGDIVRLYLNKEDQND